MRRDPVVSESPAGDVLGPRLIPLSVDDDSRSTVPIDPVHERIPSTVAASSRAVARNLEEFQSTAGDDQEMRASGVQFHTGSDTSNRVVQTLGELDTDSIVGMSDQGDGVEVINATPAEVPVAFIPRTTQYSDAFASLDGVQRCVRFQESVPFFLRGVFSGAVRVSLQAILRGYEQRSELRIARVWKLFMLLPRLLLVQTSKRWETPQESTGRAFPIVSGRPMVGIVGILSGDKAPSPSVFRQTPPPSEARPWNSEARGPGTQSGALGELSAVREALEGANVARERWPH